MIRRLHTIVMAVVLGSFITAATGCSKKGAGSALHIVVGKSRLSFSAVQNGPLPAMQEIEISSEGDGTLEGSASDDADWLDLSPSNWSGKGILSVSVNTTARPIGRDSATITISSPTAENSPQTVLVYFATVPPVIPTHLALEPAELSFTAPRRGALPPVASFVISNTGDGTMTWSLSDSGAQWLDESPKSGESNNQAVTVTVLTTDLSVGEHSAQIVVTSSNADNSPGVVAVHYAVTPASGHITLSKTAMFLAAVRHGMLPNNEKFTIANAGTGTLGWEITCDSAWLAASPQSGISNNATITVSANSTALPLGEHISLLRVSSANADNSPQTIVVSYMIANDENRIAISPDTLEFRAVQNGALPDSQGFMITNVQGRALIWRLDDHETGWLDEDPMSGVGNNQWVTVRVNTTNLFPGVYETLIVVTDSSTAYQPAAVHVLYAITP